MREREGRREGRGGERERGSASEHASSAVLATAAQATLQEGDGRGPHPSRRVRDRGMAVGLTVSTRERERERESAPSSAVPATAEDSETGREMADPLCPRSRRGMAVGHTSSETAALTLCVWRPSGHPAPSSTARPGPGVLSLTYVAAHRAFQQRPEIRNVHHGAGGSAPPLGPYQAGSFAGHAVCAPQRGARPRLDSIPPRRISAPQLSLQVPVQHRAPTLFS